MRDVEVWFSGDRKEPRAAEAVKDRLAGWPPALPACKPLGSNAGQTLSPPTARQAVLRLSERHARIAAWWPFSRVRCPAADRPGNPADAGGGPSHARAPRGVRW